MKILGPGNRTTLLISNDEIHDFIKIIKSLEENEVQNEAKEQKGGFFSGVSF